MKTGFELDPNEQVIETVYRHWIDLFPIIFSSTFLGLFVVALAYVYGRYNSYFSFIPAVVITVLAVVLLTLAAIFLLLGLWIYRQNRLMITNMHLIQIEQVGLFNRRVSQLSLARVQDVSGRRTGLLATLLDYGDVEIQSAGEEEKFVFRNAPQPQELSDNCLDAHEKFISDNPNRELP